MGSSRSLRLSATLLFVGLLVLAVVAVGLHPREVDPNNNAASFAHYAKSAEWAAVHLGQFVGMSILLAGLIVLFFALDLTNGAVRWIGLFGAISAGLALVLYAVQMAVDGEALKQAVDAWASAPAGNQATRFAAAEAVRWLEWGTASYQSLIGGLTLVLFGIVIAWTGRA